MKNIFTLGILAFLLLSSCRKAPDIIVSHNGSGKEKVDSPAYIIRGGTSFGECGGYCRTILEVDSLDLGFTELSWGDTVAFPTKHQSGKLTPSERECLMSVVNLEAFMKLDTIIGCPDCADGGAEWVEIEKDGVTRRVTFEHGASVPAIQGLIDKLRLLRANFKGQGNYIYQTWDWVQSSGGIAGVTNTPASTGYREQAVYRLDGRYELYRNDSLIRSTTYTITYKEINGTGHSVILYADDQVEQIMQLEGDTLKLSDQCADCFDHVFARATSVCAR